MAVFNSLTIGGINSLDYGIYITGEGVYDAPNRAVEMVEIHGRNGALILDKGHFENIEIKYPCGSFGEGNKTFEQRITEFKNAVLSLKGYQRLTDTYATDVYRLASCANGFEVAPVQGGKAGEFDLVFNCKPQRFLTSGETLVTVANNGTVTNPTAFDSQPVIQTNGYGAITFNGHKINISNAVMGNVQILNGTPLTLDSYTAQEYGNATAVFKSDAIPVAAYANNGDSFTALVDIDLQLSITRTVSSAAITTAPSNASASITKSGTNIAIKIKNAELSGAVGSNASASDSCAALVSYKTGGETVSVPLEMTFSLAYSTANKVVTVTVTLVDAWYWSWGETRTTESLSFTVDSTVSILGNPTYIDCEIGEAYKIESNQFVSLNRYIDLGSDLPTLASGTNTFTKSNTITSLKVKPNWWKL